MEIGSLLADRDPVTRENRYPANNHMDYIAAAAKNVFDRRESITRGYKIVKELPIMRHFTIELDRADR